ncbi:MAG: family N-acetyltransferase [Cyanobacteria bacterium RYN_339]|nr:family N-acetyltransferase [Cyanobacteria bacterium RYN_339]
MTEPTIIFRIDDLQAAPVRALVAHHLAGMADQTPAEHVHALGIEKLRAPDITFWSAWIGDEVVGCGALRRLDGERGEIKSMRVADAWLGHGVGRAILHHIIAHARGLGLRSLWLETGKPFQAARALYERTGFQYCDAFGSYVAGEFSVFMTLEL